MCLNSKSLEPLEKLNVSTEYHQTEASMPKPTFLSVYQHVPTFTTHHQSASQPIMCPREIFATRHALRSLHASLWKAQSEAWSDTATTPRDLKT